MALHILQPGLRPIGQFDLAGSTTCVGGEIGVLANQTGTGAADATQVGPINYNSDSPVGLMVSLTRATAGQLRFLIDDGQDEYGTLLGSIVGGNAGAMTQFGGGAVVVGPATHLASGKATCWHAPGLYAVSGAAAANLADQNTNTALYGTNSTGILTEDSASNGGSVALLVGGMYDSSLVSTTLLAADETQTADKHAIYFLGQ
jgi:hypothetical protein